MDQILELLFQACVEENRTILNDPIYKTRGRDILREEERVQSLVTGIEWKNLEPYFDALAIRDARYDYLCFREGFLVALRLLSGALSG